MIAITNDAGLTLNLTPGQNLLTELNVAWLSDEELPGEFSYQFDAPLDPNNKRFVANAYRPDLAQPRSEMPVTVRMDGVLYRRCIYAYRVNAGKLSGFLKIDSSEFYDRIRSLSLLDALTEVVPLGDGLASNPPVAIDVRLKQIAAQPPGQFPCTFFPIRNETMLEESFDESKLGGFVRNSYINAWEPLSGGSFGFKVDLPNMPRFGYLVCPQFYLSYVLVQIMKLAGYRIESDWLASEEAQRLTVQNLTAMNMAVTDLTDFIEGHKLVPGQFLPPVSVSDFLKAVKGRFGLVFTYNANDRICHIAQFTREVAAGSQIDLTEFQSGDYSTYERDGKGYAVSDYIDESDELYKDSAGQLIRSPAQIIGKGQTEVSLKAGTSQLIYEKSPLAANAYWFVPTVRQPGNVLDKNYKLSDRYLTKEGNRPNGIGIKFLSYRGMTLDSGNHPYPLGTPDIRDGKQVAVGSEALVLPGHNGAWQTYLRAYYYFRDQTQRVTQPLLLPVAILASLQLHRLVSLTLEDQIRRSYLISKIQADGPGPDGKAPVRLEVLTLPAGIELPAEVDVTAVWVELILGPLVVNDSRRDLVDYATHANSLTIKCWKDAARTQPATATNLLVTIRVKKTWDTNTTTPPPQLYQETLVSYVANGSTSVVDPVFINYYSEFAGVSYRLIWRQTGTLDPGEGYNILI